MNTYAAIEYALSVIAIEATASNVRAFILRERLVAVAASLGEERDTTTAWQARARGSCELAAITVRSGEENEAAVAFDPRRVNSEESAPASLGGWGDSEAGATADSIQTAVTELDG